MTVTEVLGDASVYMAREMIEECQDIETAGGPQPHAKLAGPLRGNWPYMPLKRWFAKQQQASITLTFLK